MRFLTLWRRGIKLGQQANNKRVMDPQTLENTQISEVFDLNLEKQLPYEQQTLSFCIVSLGTPNRTIKTS